MIQKFFHNKKYSRSKPGISKNNFINQKFPKPFLKIL